MKNLLLTYKGKPLVMAGHAWLVLCFSLFATYGFLPYAQKLYNGDYQLAGLLLHRSLVILFMLAASLAGLSILAQIYAQFTKRDLTILQRVINVVKSVFAALPAVFLSCAGALLLLVGKYLGLTLD